MNNPIIRFKKVDGSDFSDWKESSFQEIFEFRSSISLSRSQLNYTTGEIKNIHYGDILLKFPSIVHTDNKLIPYINQDCIPNKYDLLEKGDVVFADTAEDYSLGKAIEIGSTPFRITSGLHTIACKAKLKFASGFLVYYLNSNFYHCQINKLATGTKVYSIIKSNIIKTKLRTPSSLEEQQKIASFFLTLDQKIELNERKIEALERLKKGLLKKIFSQELRFRDKNGRDFPLWNEVVLSSISGKITVGIANSATHAYTKRGIALIRNTNIKPNYLDETDIAHITQDFAKKYESKKLKADDILICRTGYPGTACLVPKKYEGAQTFTTLIVRIDKSYALPAYVCQYINSDRGKEYLNKTSIGGGQKNSGAGIIKDLLIPIPCIDEQYAILEILQSLDNKISIITTKLDSIKRLKQGFMQQMFI